MFGRVAATVSGCDNHPVIPGERQTSARTTLLVGIGQQLRTMFDDVVKQGVPDRFVDLLGRLDQNDDKKR